MKKYLIAIMTIIAIAAWTCPVAAVEAGDVNTHGFISQGFLRSNEYNYLSDKSEEGSYEYSEMGINFSKQLTEKLHAGLQLFARDLGDVANNKVTLDWAYGDYRYQDWLGLRVGKIKLPLGLYNETRDMDMLRTSIVLPQGIYNDLVRDTGIAVTGVGLYGDLNLQTAGGLNYQLIAGGLNMDSESGVGKYANDWFASSGGRLNGDMKGDETYVIAIQWDTPLDGFKTKYSFIKSDVETPVIITIPYIGDIEATSEGSTFIEIYSAEYTWNDLVMAAEYMQEENKYKMLGTETIRKLESYYLSASYAFTDLFTFGVYYSEYYPNKDDKEGNTLAIKHKAWEKDLALTLRFDLNDYWVLKIEGHSVDGTANVLASDNANSTFNDSKWYYGAAKMTFSF